MSLTQIYLRAINGIRNIQGLALIWAALLDTNLRDQEKSLQEKWTAWGFFCKNNKATLFQA